MEWYWVWELKNPYELLTLPTAALLRRQPPCTAPLPTRSVGHHFKRPRFVLRKSCLSESALPTALAAGLLRNARAGMSKDQYFTLTCTP